MRDALIDARVEHSQPGYSVEPAVTLLQARECRMRFHACSATHGSVNGSVHAWLEFECTHSNRPKEDLPHMRMLRHTCTCARAKLETWMRTPRPGMYKPKRVDVAARNTKSSIADIDVDMPHMVHLHHQCYPVAGGAGTRRLEK
jgi:hypothetical protein